METNSTPQPKKLSLIVFSGDFDKLTAAFTLATGAAAVGYEVNMFFTFWGLNAIKAKQGHSPLGKGMLAKVFNFLSGGIKSAPVSRLNFCGASPLLMRNMMRKKHIATLEELLKAANDLGINLYACEMAMVILELTKYDFIHEVKDVLGVPTFLELSEGGRTLFI